MTRSFTILFALILTFSALCTTAQVKNVQEEAEKQGTKRVNRKIDKGIDKGFDKIEEGIGSLFGKKKKKKEEDNDNASSENQNQNAETTNANASGSPATAPTMNVQWSRFDFVPGDEVIFEDGPDIMEENGEFPSRWDLHEGNSEIVNVNGENVIAFPQGGTIMPYLENAKEDYLPEVFTVEMDAYFRPGYARRLWVNFWDEKNQRYNDNETITFYINSVSLSKVDTEGALPGVKSNNSEHGGWRHFSIAYTKGKLKVYIDDTRLINVPRCVGNPSGISLKMDGYSADKPEDLQYIKNFRIAKGGVKYYDRVLSDGKIIVNGIRFDVNKATLKPESMGPINKIFELMQKQPDLKFSVEGHTDSDGDDAKNQTLSEQRAKTVMAQLISMGIAADRLTSKGFGESVPVDNNTTAEGKANNRRVEFVKF
ncbi:OmpA family protein [uncultured Draconibacterium sp.]|uniref:OmpA family protein n=1 Tax=uncultured Draconibacterium sp. TaxID=1573823 RepID=UPI002AA813CE|nr:OmpA family protein [uncultured Draconibacterium sp.]